MSREIPCPVCGQKGDWFQTPFGPFCSDRCKMVDLGKWLGEEYRIASPLTVEDLQELEDDGDAENHPAANSHVRD
jgi:endogenous inhibitor of DNA gyrase (YacG/DUF329 family)